MDFVTWSAEFFAWANSFAETWGYLGIFAISFIGNASIIFPLPSAIIVFAFGSILNPWLLGLSAGIAAALGELTGYFLGRGGGKLLNKKQKKIFEKTRKWAEKHGIFPIIILFAAAPLPDDITGILAGIMKYDVKKFLAATLIGKLIFYTILAWAGFYGMAGILELLT